MEIITQKEVLSVLDKIHYPHKGGELRFIQRFMFKLQDLAKKKGYRLFHWTDYIIPIGLYDVYGSWIVSNIEELSKELSKHKEGE